MAVQLVEGGITVGVPTLEDGFRLGKRVYTKSSDLLLWPDGVMYAFERGKVLQKADTAVGFMHDSEGADNSLDYQLTRTVTGYAPASSGVRAYVGELPSEKLVEFAEKVRGKSYLEVRLDSEFAQLLKRLGAKRTFVVPDENLELSVIRRSGRTEYGSNHNVRCYLPRNAEKHAANIRRKYKTSEVWFDHSRVSKGKMRIRPCSVGGNIINIVNIDDFYYVGRARGE